jgi:RNA polymerase sigma factor (sigma-70 family)
MMTDDSQLLASYAHHGAGDAFQRLVERHINFVYASALRQTGNPHTAEDITQAVFLLFSQRAGRLKPGTVVKGWLFNTTRYVVANSRRAEARRKFHERKAAVMHSDIVREDHWTEIPPHLDDAMARLSESDRRILLLRFFEDLPLAAVGQVLGISQEAAKKRVARAVEHLRHLLVGRGATGAGNSIERVFQATSAQIAPAYLAKMTVDLVLNGASGVAKSGSAFSLAKGATKMMSFARAKLLAIQCVIAGASIGTVAVLAHSESKAVPSHPSDRVLVAMADAAANSPAADAPDADYNACCQVLQSIVDAFDRNDLAAVDALYYFKPGSDPKTTAVIHDIHEMQVANYRLKKAAVTRFGMHGTLLFTGVTTDAECWVEYLTRVGPQNARLAGDTLTITPSAHGFLDVGAGRATFNFLRDQGVWKLDAARSFSATFRAARRQPVAGESSVQTLAAAVDLIAGHFDAIADNIDKGNIADEAEVQRRVSATWDDLNSHFREFGCSIHVH